VFQRGILEIRSSSDMSESENRPTALEGQENLFLTDEKPASELPRPLIDRCP